MSINLAHSLIGSWQEMDQALSQSSSHMKAMKHWLDISFASNNRGTDVHVHSVFFEVTVIVSEMNRNPLWKRHSQKLKLTSDYQLIQQVCLARRCRDFAATLRLLTVALRLADYDACAQTDN